MKHKIGNAGGSHFITESNYEDCVSVLAARNLISTNWVIDKDLLNLLSNIENYLMNLIQNTKSITGMLVGIKLKHY